MPHALDRRLARLAAKGTPADDTLAAGHRNGLRARAKVGAFLRARLRPCDTGPAFERALRLGDEAAAALARIPDTPELESADEACENEAEAEAGAQRLWAKLGEMVRFYREGGELDTNSASQAEVLAWCIAREEAGSEEAGAKCARAEQDA